MPLKLNSSSLTCSICALAAIILQLVAMKCQELQMVDSSIERDRNRNHYLENVYNHEKEGIVQIGQEYERLYLEEETDEIEGEPLVSKTITDKIK